MQGSVLCCTCVKSTPFCCEQGLRQDQTQAAAGPVRPATGGGGRGVCVTHVQGQRSDHSPIASAPQSRALQDMGGRGPLRVPRRPHYADTNQTRTARSRRTADRHPSRTRAQSTTRHRQAESLIHTKNNTSQPGGFISGCRLFSSDKYTNVADRTASLKGKHRTYHSSLGKAGPEEIQRALMVKERRREPVHRDPAAQHTSRKHHTLGEPAWPPPGAWPSLLSPAPCA